MSRGNDMRRFLQICIALTAERDREELLTTILDAAIEMASCDAGTLYLSGDDGLHFCRMVTKSRGIRQGGHNDPITLPPVPMEPKYVAAWSAMHQEAINVIDVHTDKHFDFTGSIRYDNMTKYHTQSMLVVPMSNDRGELIGVMQLINAQDDDGNTISFSKRIEPLITAIASQAAICISNTLYSEQVSALLDSLVGALSTAIDERTPYNANHTRNMVHYASNFLDWMNTTDNGWRFDDDKRRTFLLSVWLHDVGKLAVPIDVMDKATRLGGRIDDIRSRFKTIRLVERVAAFEGKLDMEEAERREKERAEALAFIESINGGCYMTDEFLNRVYAFEDMTYIDEDGTSKPLLTEDEITCLLIKKGTLTDEERRVMQSHVVVTDHILSNVKFPKLYEKTPHWAAMHHELLNGKGYPKHLIGKDIPQEVRLLTILDIFDALTARDRPYKKGVSPDKALHILRDMAENDGSIDKHILDMFEESRAWEG